MMSLKESLQTIKDIDLTCLDWDEDEDMDGEWEYTPIERSYGSVEENYPEEIETIEKFIDIVTKRLVDIALIKECESEPEYLNHLCHRVVAEQPEYKLDYRRLSEDEFNFLKDVINEYRI